MVVHLPTVDICSIFGCRCCCKRVLCVRVGDCDSVHACLPLSVCNSVRMTVRLHALDVCSGLDASGVVVIGVVDRLNAGVCMCVCRYM